MQVRLDAPVPVEHPPLAPRVASATAALTDVRLDIYEDMATIAEEWRAFERHADGSVFQTYDWLATWQRCIGIRTGVRPAVVVGRDAAGAMLLLLPLAVSRTALARTLTWLGSDLCDYNGPLLASDFSRMLPTPQVSATVRMILQRVQEHPRLGYDIVRLDKMPEAIGAQSNPMLCLPTTLNPSGAYLTQLGDSWEAFYQAKRSAATRRRDRTKRKRLAEFGDIQLVTPTDKDDILHTLDALMVQKAQAFAAMGVPNIFARAGYREFYRALATDPASRHLAHVSRLQVGEESGAINLGLTFRDCYYHLLASYTDSELARFGPGAAHLHDLMSYAIDRGCRTFDFTIGDERYKRDWCEIECKLHDYIAGVTPRGVLVAGRLRVALALKRKIKQTPVLWSAASKVREWIGSLKRLKNR